MYTFNSNLFIALPRLLGHTRNSISLLLGYSKDTMRRFSDPETCRVKFLVDLCNYFHLDISKFFVSDETAPEYSISPIDEQHWSPITINDVDMSKYMARKDVFSCANLVYAMNFGVKFSDVISHKLNRQVVNEVNCTVGKKADEGYWFNVDLFRMLPEKLGINVVSIGKSIGRTAHLYDNVMKNRDIRVYTLVEVCNKHRIPITLFFRKPGDVMAEHIVDEKMSDVMFYPFRISEFYGKGKKYTYNQIKELLGYTNPRMIRATAEDSPMTAVELISICEKLKIPPRFFFADPISLMNEEDANYTRNIIEKLKEDVEQKDIENRMLRSRLRHLESMMNMKK